MSPLRGHGPVDLEALEGAVAHGVADCCPGAPGQLHGAVLTDKVGRISADRFTRCRRGGVEACAAGL